ncbi:MAG: four helix bundle protein [Parcubacteria group bacterium]
MDNNKNFTSIEIPLIKKLYELYKYAHKSISVFPKHERYSLGEKIEMNILEAIELTVFGNAQPKNFKDGYLLKANAKVEVLKILFRLSLDNEFINQTQYIKAEEYLQEAGRMLGGWIKYLKSDFVKYENKDEKETPKK